MVPERGLKAIERLIAIYDLLQSEQINAAKLAKMFNVSTRTIYRDIKKMQYAGVDIYSYPEGYKII